MSIITSLLDNDFYKFTMAQAVLHNYPAAWVKYKFKCRSRHLIPPMMNTEEFCKEVNKQLDDFCKLTFKQDELLYLSLIRFFTPDFIEYLRIFKPNREYIRCYVDPYPRPNEREFQLIIEGPWISTILFEVPLLAIISEVYFANRGIYEITRFQLGNEILTEKINYIKSSIHRDALLDFWFADFGTRRRFSFDWQSAVLSRLVKCVPEHLIGTSNVFFAKMLNIKPIGTMAHEWVCAHQHLGGDLERSQINSFKTWVEEYQGELGIALSDTLGFNAFLRDFNLFFAKLSDGARHDSGNPYEWCRRLIDHYIRLGIDPKTKTAVFSDGLNMNLAVSLFNEFHPRIKTSFGIGTNLTNDVGINPLQIVIKMVECNGSPVAKISDSEGKGMCEDKQYLSYLKTVFKIVEK
jgi:nicotinate phosphoribosyltransferase